MLKKIITDKEAKALAKSDDMDEEIDAVLNWYVNNYQKYDWIEEMIPQHSIWQGEIPGNEGIKLYYTTDRNFYFLVDDRDY